MKKIVRLITFIILLTTIGCTNEKKILESAHPVLNEQSTKPPSLNDQDDKDEVIEKEKILSNEETIELQIENTLYNMTIEEKIGQMFILAFRNDSSGIPIENINEDIKTIISKYNIGGVILFQRI